MNQSRKHAFLGQLFQIGAWVAQPGSEEAYRTHLKLAPYQVIQRHAARYQIPSGGSWIENNLFFTVQRLDSFDFNQSDISAAAGGF